MAQELQKPNNLFATPQLTKPTGVYDPNKGWRGYADYRNITAAQKIRPTQPQQQQTTEPQYQTQTKPVITSTEDLAKAMGYTSPQEEERLRKASVANQRILALGDALRHIGNIAGTINYAPSQKLSSPVQEEYARYQQGKAMRDKANQAYYSYQQKKAEQDAKARQWEAEAAYRDASIGIRKAEHQRLIDAQKLAERKQDYYEKLKQEQYELDKAYKEHKMTLEEYNAKSKRISADAAWLRAEKYVPGGSSGVGGYTVTEETQVHRDKFGKETGRTKTKTRTGSNGQSTTTTNGNNTPPSRRNSSSQNGNNNNVPPSRRKK